jgi:hypothetical protein
MITTITRCAAVVLLPLLLAAGLATAASPAHASTARPAAQTAYYPYPLCAAEDSRGPCAWYAQLQGNGTGRSFAVTADQRVHYAPAPRLTWHRVIRYCHRTHVCHPVPGWLRKALGIGDRPARIIWGDTTRVLIKARHGNGVTIETS